MDILVSSNLERLLSLLTGDDSYVASLMKDLNEQGHYKVTEELLRKLQSEFSCGCCDDDAAGRTIGKVWAQEKYLLDPHTAVAWTVADQFSHTHHDGAPDVVLSTASPYKFPAAVLSALGQRVSDDEFAVMDDLYACTGVPAAQKPGGSAGKNPCATGMLSTGRICSPMFSGKQVKSNGNRPRPRHHRQLGPRLRYPGSGPGPV